MCRTLNIKSIEPRIFIFQFVGYTKYKNRLNKMGLLCYLISVGPKGRDHPEI